MEIAVRWFMLFQRRKNQQVHDSRQDGFVRYLMADSSTQHRRDFEHIMIASIACEDLRDVYLASCQLLDVWRLF